jgi:hypothetical protein
LSFINESLGGENGQLASALQAGVEVLSENQTVTFVKYVRVILPFDGYVFWVRADILSESALENAAMYNALIFNQPLQSLAGAPTFVAKGSLHYATALQEDLTESYALNRMIFTAEQAVNPLDAVSPMVMYLATIGPFRYAFSQRESFYKQAGLWHYLGDTVNPTLENQIIDVVEDFDADNIIVSNSLPIWLSLNSFSGTYIPMFPAYLVPMNMKPPFGVVDVYEGSPRALQAFPHIDHRSNHWQLVSDYVKITLYGLRNFNALDYQDYILDQSLNTDVFGIMNMPVIRDEKKKQVEINIIAQKKSIEFEISYYQPRIREVARQLILHCIPNFWIYPQDPTIVPFVIDVPLSYEGPFTQNEVLPRVLFMDTTTLTRGIAFTASTGNFEIGFYDQNNTLQITVIGLTGQNTPQVTYVNPPSITFYINQYLTPVVIQADPNLLDLAVTLGTNPT